MNGLLLCLLAFCSCFATGILSWRTGLGSLVVWGYAYGILKARFWDSASLFIFDAATIGFYLAFLVTDEFKLIRPEVKRWIWVLMAWPIFMAFVPIQHYVVQMVGLRGNIFWLPMILIGYTFGRIDKSFLPELLSLLNIVAFGFALGEYFWGVELFVPENEASRVVYISEDIAGGHKRIPSVFMSAHAYAGMMVVSLPWIFGAILDRSKAGVNVVLGFPLLVAGVFFALLGIFIAGPRGPVVTLGFLTLFYLLFGKANWLFYFAVTVFGLAAGYFVAQNERMQRFAELQDVELMANRLQVSLNMSFFEVLLDYPMGNGMGAGGTNMPGFAQSLLVGRIMLENEYARILLEQGLVGLILFMAFIVWFSIKCWRQKSLCTNSWNLNYFLTVFSFGTAWIGIGLMSGIPTTMFFLFGVGACLSGDNFVSGEAHSTKQNRVIFGYQPAYQRGLARA